MIIAWFLLPITIFASTFYVWYADFADMQITLEDTSGRNTIYLGADDSRQANALNYEAGFLKLRKDGLWSLYSIDKDGMKEYLADLIKALTKALENNETVVHDRERLMKAERVGPGCAEGIRG